MVVVSAPHCSDSIKAQLHSCPAPAGAGGGWQGRLPLGRPASFLEALGCCPTFLIQPGWRREPRGVREAGAPTLVSSANPFPASGGAPFPAVLRAEPSTMDPTVSGPCHSCLDQTPIQCPPLDTNLPDKFNQGHRECAWIRGAQEWGPVLPQSGSKVTPALVCIVQMGPSPRGQVKRATHVPLKNACLPVV